jgi:hypothetical protein
MKLGIFGDSYADINCPNISLHDNDSQPWPKILESLMGADSEFFGVSSTSLWFSYQLFLQNYKKFDNIVFCYTEYNRWNSISNPEFINLSTIKFKEQLVNLQNKDKNFIDAAKKLVDVHPILDSEEFNVFVYQTIFNNVNTICKTNNIKLINLMPFDVFPTRKTKNIKLMNLMPAEVFREPAIDISNHSGACITGIHEVGIREQYQIQVDGIDSRYCHLSSDNNKRLAKTINDLWETNSLVTFR